CEHYTCIFFNQDTIINKYETSLVFFFSSRRRHTRWPRDWSSDVCSSDLSCGGSMKPAVDTIVGWLHAAAAGCMNQERDAAVALRVRPILSDREEDLGRRVVVGHEHASIIRVQAVA